MEMEKISEDPAYQRGEKAGFDAERLFWRQFVEAATPKAFCQSWLPLQCRMLKGVRCGMVLLGPADQGPFTPVAVWPDAKLTMSHLTGAAERALRERRGLLVAGEEAGEAENVHVAYPVEVSGSLHGVVVLEVEESPRHELQSVLRMLHWGAAWLEVMIRRGEAQKTSELTERLKRALDLVAGTVEHEGFQGGAMALVTRMAMTLECDRVSMGFLVRNQVRVKAVSHAAEFGKQTNLVRAIGAAMDEAVDQRATVVFPLPPESLPLVTRAHEELSKQHGSGAILTIPLESKGRPAGGLTLERTGDKPFDRDTVEVCETVAALVGPILDTKRREERWLIRKAVDSGADQLRRVLGPGYLLRKLALAAVACVIVFFSLFEVDYRVTAPTSIEGEVQRVVAAPFNGYIREAPVRPGDVVEEGDLLCFLDDRDLKLERLKWGTEKEQLTKQYHEAMAKRERARIRITKAKIDQAEAQLSLIEEQLARTRVVAPFHGVVLSGDLSQSLGSPVERGQELFTVAPLDAYRVVVEVDERVITHIREGQKSELVLPSMPGEVFPFVVSKITPVSLAKEGRNYFRVEARMEKVSDRLRPGMEGVGKIEIDRRKLIWVWTHEAVDWLRLKAWRYTP
jgi:biotin carboxyl carrier protein/GAF domain-containing protein